MMRPTIIAALVAVLAGCPAPVCSTLASRCDGQHAMLCDADGQWQTVADCDEVAASSGGEWTCQPTSSDGVEVHACLPRGER